MSQPGNRRSSRSWRLQRHVLLNFLSNYKRDLKVQPIQGEEKLFLTNKYEKVLAGEITFKFKKNVSMSKRLSDQTQKLVFVVSAAKVRTMPLGLVDA